MYVLFIDLYTIQRKVKYEIHDSPADTWQYRHILNSVRLSIMRSLFAKWPKDLVFINSLNKIEPSYDQYLPQSEKNMKEVWELKEIVCLVRNNPL